MGLLSALGKITGIEKNIKWAMSKELIVDGPNFLGQFKIYISKIGKVAVILPKSDMTIHIFLGDLAGANQWIKCDANGKRELDEPISSKSVRWRIKEKKILLRGNMLSPNDQIFYLQILNVSIFNDDISELWINQKIMEYLKIMSKNLIMTEDKSKSSGIHQNDRIARVERSIPLTNKHLSAIDETVTDIDGNVYKTVKIGNQVWMAENIKVTCYRNGDPIPTGFSDKKWVNLKTGAYCFYDDNPMNIDVYGNLYNWYAVNDSRYIAPEGWHVPSELEWIELEMKLGLSDDDVNNFNHRGTNQGSQLAGGIEIWRRGILTDDSAFGSSGFHAIPGGFRDCYDGSYTDIGKYGSIWSSTEGPCSITGPCGDAWFRLLHYEDSTLCQQAFNIHYGCSVRCVKD